MAGELQIAFPFGQRPLVRLNRGFYGMGYCAPRPYKGGELEMLCSSEYRLVQICPRSQERIIHPLLPMKRKSMEMSTKSRSTAFDLRFFSWKTSAPNRKLTTTEPRRTMETMEIMAPSRPRA